MKSCTTRLPILKKHVDEVIFDAEHFFDGYHDAPDFAIDCIKAVDEAGVDLICLCDTNGGRLPFEIEDGVKAALARGARADRNSLS